MKKVLLAVTGFIAVAMLFTGVGYAAATWLKFTGDEQIEQSQNNVDEILAILDNVAEKGKIDKEQVDTLTARVKELSEENERLNTEKGILSTELASANQDKTNAENALAGKEQELQSKKQELEGKQTEINNKQTEINNKQQEINDKNVAYDALQKERDNIVIERDNYKAQVDENRNYIKHLEAELTRANNLVEEHADYTEQAVEKARTYK